MASSDHPETPPTSPDAPATTGIQTSPETAAAPTIPLPPLPQPSPLTVAKFTRLRGGLDGVLVVLVLVFAFLVASSPVNNPDFFRQLATGRLLAQGDYHFGVDPFTYTSDGAYWVNHSWLFALMVYGLYQIPMIGGAAVVVGKALIVTVLAGILLRTQPASRPEPVDSRRLYGACYTHDKPSPLSATVFPILPLSRSDSVDFNRYPLSAVRCPQTDSGQRTADSG